MKKSEIKTIQALNSRSLCTEVAGALRKRRLTPTTYRCALSQSPHHAVGRSDSCIFVVYSARLETPGQEADRRQLTVCVFISGGFREGPGMAMAPSRPHLC